MTDPDTRFVDPERVRQYLHNGPLAFTPGHAGLMQMIGVLLGETMPTDGTVLVIGAGGGLETRYLASVEPRWRFVGVDPAAAMLDLARATAGEAAGDRLTLITGTVADVPERRFDAATCILVLGLVPDDGSKLALLRQTRRRLNPGAPFVLVDQCLDRHAHDFDQRLDRYGRLCPTIGRRRRDRRQCEGRRGGVEKHGIGIAQRAIADDAGFGRTELFYLGMAWRGWLSYADGRQDATLPRR